MKLIKHPIRDALLFWFGRRLLRRNAAKKSGMRSSRPFSGDKSIR